jgi:hypothetical protein
MLQARLEAVLRAEIPPSPSGSLPTPLSTMPTSPLAALLCCRLGVAVVPESQDTPLHPPSGRGDERRRQANPKPHVEYWRELLAYVDAAYRKKFGRHYPWNNLSRKNVWNLARAYSAWEVMALWDLYLGSESWWARKTGWSVYGMIRDAERLMDDPRVKQSAVKHEQSIAERCFGGRANPSDIFNSLFPQSASKLSLLGGG